MSAFEMAARDAASVKVDSTAIEALEGDLRGSVLLPASAGYDQARLIWNGMIDRHPAMIVRCAGAADVAAAVNFGREHDLLIAVKGGGHNVAGNAVCDGGLMIDLSDMRYVRADPGTRRARAGGGATWGDFDAETQIFGLATTGGLISGTGVAGLTLGGGIGWLSRSHGLACDNLVSVDVVTAAGDRVRASEDENPDLFWGLKGGSGNFGIATSFEFQLHPVGPSVFAGMTLYPLDEAQEMLLWFRDFMAQAPDALGGLAGLVATPDGAQVLALIGVYNDEPSQGEAVLKPLRQARQPLLDTFAATPYRRIQTLFDAGSPPGLRYYWKSSFLDSLPAEAAETVVAQARKSPSPSSKVFVEFLGGAVSRIPRESAVFDHRGSSYNLLIIGGWENPAQDEANRTWVRETWQAMKPFESEGVYVNYLGTESDEGGNRLAEAYGPGKYERLVALKRKYDPTNLFRMNQNIRPDASG
ncbi:FAD-binding oxidoreductase [Pelagibius marinus]|uniref:FAD-binding oxidoreductase n=1 Tax=Pelagibius marinus TaxID=2762760 RepID=UPI001D038C11|nr:FAD-binding oxidoreductase [Pelagibius marinus]